ncbi:hypothetical protein ACH5RR_001746 [Cinchona calisaya]|uniref:Peptidase S59 domain-containing protein n=2 Tax=Cinchona calisaya TaxID=153742 RepID=A0ABD3B4A8_9GENT
MNNWIKKVNESDRGHHQLNFFFFFFFWISAIVDGDLHIQNRYISQAPTFSFPMPSQNLNPHTSSITSGNTFPRPAVATTCNSAGVTMSSGFGGDQSGGSRIASYAATSTEDAINYKLCTDKIHSISTVPIFRGKSQELRLEDYKSGDKGGHRSRNQLAGGFGVSSSTLGKNTFHPPTEPTKKSFNSSLPLPSNPPTRQRSASWHSNRRAFSLTAPAVLPNKSSSVRRYTPPMPHVQPFAFPGTGAPYSADPFWAASSASYAMPSQFSAPIDLTPVLPNPQNFDFLGAVASPPPYWYPSVGVPSSYYPFWAASSALATWPAVLPSPSAPDLPNVPHFSFPGAGASNAYSSGAPSSADPFRTASSAPARSLAATPSPSTPVLPNAQHFPGAGASTPAYSFPSPGASSSANPFWSPNPFPLSSSSPPSVPHVQLFLSPGNGASTPAHILPASAALSSVNPVPTASSASAKLSDPVSNPSISSYLDPGSSASLEPSLSFSFSRADGKNSGFISGFSSSSTPARPVKISDCPICRKSSSFGLSGIPSQRSSSREATSEGGLSQNSFSSTPSCANNLAGCNKSEVTFAASPPIADHEDTVSAGDSSQVSTVLLCTSKGANESRVATQTGGQDINGQKSASVSGEVIQSTFRAQPAVQIFINSPSCTLSIQRDISPPYMYVFEFESIHRYLAICASCEEATTAGGLSMGSLHTSLAQNLIPSQEYDFRSNCPEVSILCNEEKTQNFKANYDNNPIPAGCFRVAVKENEDGEAVANVGQNPDVTAIMPKIRCPFYYIKPTIKELEARERAQSGFCQHVKDFVVGKLGYGSIKFSGEIDVRELNIASLFQFNYREVVVYMDYRKKPPIGQGLNRPAEVTLLNVECIDKTGEPCTDGTKVEKYREMLKKKAEEIGAEMVYYDPIKVSLPPPGGYWPPPYYYNPPPPPGGYWPPPYYYNPSPPPSIDYNAPPPPDPILTYLSFYYKNPPPPPDIFSSATLLNVPWAKRL